MMCNTPVYEIGSLRGMADTGNRFYIKREDLIPFSFGGNKARKAALFFKDIDDKQSDYVVTYGSGSSNHCRVVANMAAAKHIPCLIIMPLETEQDTMNMLITGLLGAQVMACRLKDVPITIDNEMQRLSAEGFRPYFIPGGGHGNLGTEAYVQCYQEIKDYEASEGVFFDYIFLASGTGTTQAGLVCGKLMNSDNREIVGISIARPNPRGRQVVVDSVKEYLGCKGIAETEADCAVTFIDDYILSGYGAYDEDVTACVNSVMHEHGVPLDCTYTGKAFNGMQKYLIAHGIAGKKVLFIHTGGAPLFFDYLKGKCR